MFKNKSFFENLHPNHHNKVTTGCGKSNLTSQGMGLAKIVDCIGNLWLLPNSLYILDLNTNLLTLSSIAKNKTQIKKTTSHFKVYIDSYAKPSFLCPITSSILETHVILSNSRCLNTQKMENSDLWHKHLGHMNKNDMKKLVKTTEISKICNDCIKGKITQLPFKQSFNVSDHILENIHLDLCGPFQTPSMASAKYFLIIVDQMSGFITTNFLKNTRDCFNHFCTFKLLVKNKFTTKIKSILTDGGGEFINKSLKNHCLKSGINHIKSPPYTPQHNPFSEREDVTRILSFPNHSTEEETNSNSNIEDSSSSIDSTSLDNESKNIFVDALEQQSKRIRVIGPRHPTLISSKIDSNNILPFSRRHTGENLTNLTQTPRMFNEAMNSLNKEKWNFAIKKEPQNIEKLNVWTLRNKKDDDHPISISHLSQFLEKPGLSHWNACIQVLRYLYYSKTLWLTFKNHGFHHIKTYADADWGNSPNDQISISGFTVVLNQHLISWRSKRQQTVSHSTTEAEYKSLSDATKETMWLTNLINEMQLTTSPLDPLLLNDNKGAIDLALNDTNHRSFKTKHMDIKSHYIRELLKKCIMLLKHVPTMAINADFLTKSVGKTILLKSLNFHNLFKKTSSPSP
ncbi:hypothetical protein O181_006671 [Austropuccinia psidii MF-1]|uniref:Integrase catalytic domain-containing protein n=1 Tax=Austropuccinia psidii MF-1 TaxID=1389203 RepID=A0A9Q3BLB7_9BASI|nr:hypothetical protein [Austropuccinia psidii MF-1]